MTKRIETAERLLEGIAGSLFEPAEYNTHSRNLHYFFHDLTLFPIVDAASLNTVLSHLDDPYLRYIPNRLYDGDVYRIFNTRDRDEACKSLAENSTIKLHKKVSRAYNSVGYVLEPPSLWPRTWVMLSVKTYTLDELNKFTRIVLGDIILDNVKHRLIAKIHNLLTTVDRNLAVCDFCHTRIGMLYHNQRCPHLNYYHLGCLKNFIESPSFTPECPVHGCNRPVDIFATSTEIVTVNNFLRYCNVCGHQLALGEHYHREPGCGHIYHYECAYVSPIVKKDRRCVNAHCRVRFTLNFRHSPVASYYSRIQGCQ